MLVSLMHVTEGNREFNLDNYDHCIVFHISEEFVLGYVRLFSIVFDGLQEFLIVSDSIQ